MKVNKNCTKAPNLIAISITNYRWYLLIQATLSVFLLNPALICSTVPVVFSVHRKSPKADFKGNLEHWAKVGQ